MPEGGPRIGFLGAGKMATALAKGWLQAGRITASTCLASDPLPAAREAFHRDSGCPVLPDNRAVVDFADLLVLAVKPQTMGALTAEIRDAVERRRPLVVSIAAGVGLAQLQSGLGATTRLIRVMPNTPCLVGASASAFAAGAHARADDLALVQTLLDDVGRAFRVPESQLDAVTGLSGSGPAFVYLTIEALSDGGVRAGLPRDIATALAAQTVLGAARMVLETGTHPGPLKDAVTSPGGTTIAGLHELERAAVRGAFISAVEAAARRAAELGKPS
ncbi:MAG: pyrroline-5-carboxylate reductase [Gemmataceae bacterium]